MSLDPNIVRMALNATGIKMGVKAVLSQMALRGYRSAQCHASQKTLAKAACCHVKTVERAIATLLKKGYIEEIPNPHQSTKRYILHFSRWCGQKVGTLPAKSRLHARQYAGQNQTMNQNMNQGSAVTATARRRVADPISSDIQKILAGIGQCVERNEPGETGQDDD